ncbi:hypothetical protein A2U01_0022127 [Trifolium medium]|uniref:Uncharacterized protein n=1 Tax=Trifolium medium TaxID=97028 RepID=A0A392NMQ2_9FABA|nr:hypothetical protein [Trifolium medium]
MTSEREQGDICPTGFWKLITQHFRRMFQNGARSGLPVGQARAVFIALLRMTSRDH